MARWTPHADERLIKAAVELFAQRGYEETTVADIASRAGLTKRTFFRYFSDKREVLFSGAQELELVWVRGLREAPEDAGPVAAVEVGLEAIAEMFTERHPFARIRARIIAANPELQERELIKLEKLASAGAIALERRGVSADAAALAARTGVGIFHLAFGRWIAQDDPGALGRLLRESMGELRKLLTT